jgi:biotin operon repressor
VSDNIIEQLLHEIGGTLTTDGATTQEICAATKLSDKVVLKKIKALRAAGRVEVGRKRVTSLVGVELYVPCYRLTTSEKPSGEKDKSKRKRTD